MRKGRPEGILQTDCRCDTARQNAHVGERAGLCGITLRPCGSSIPRKTETARQLSASCELLGSLTGSYYWSTASASDRAGSREPSARQHVLLPQQRVSAGHSLGPAVVDSAQKTAPARSAAILRRMGIPETGAASGVVAPGSSHVSRAILHTLLASQQCAPSEQQTASSIGQHAKLGVEAKQERRRCVGGGGGERGGYARERER